MPWPCIRRSDGSFKQVSPGRFVMAFDKVFNGTGLDAEYSVLDMSECEEPKTLGTCSYAMVQLFVEERPSLIFYARSYLPANGSVYETMAAAANRSLTTIKKNGVEPRPEDPFRLEPWPVGCWD